MAKIVLTINANNKATESVKLLNAEVQTLSKTLSTIKVNKNLTTQINALTKHYTALAKAAVRVNEATTKRQIAEQRLANEVKRGRTEDQRTLKVKAQKEQAELRLKQAQDKATQSTQKQTTATKQNTAVNKEHRQSILSMTRGIFEWQIATTLVMKPLRALQDALASINETLVKTEDSVIALQRVLPQGSATDGEISSRLYKIAQDYGQTFDNVSQIAENFARTGMSWADTIKATEAAVLALNVAELDATEASEGLISILTQFNKETSDLTEVVDKLNKTADKNPVTTEKLLKALQRTGAAAKNANFSLDDTIGIITTLSKATNRSGENLGTAVNSLIQFSSKASSLKVFKELGGDVATAVEKYQAGAGSILEIWEKLGAVIKDRQGNAESILGGGLFSDEDWAGLNEELKEALGESYADVTDIYDTASTFRKNYFIALLNDMENVKKVSDEIANAQGYSQDENQKYLDTYTAKLNTLKAQWEELANSEQGLLGLKKLFVDLGSAVLWVVKHAGGLRTILFAISTIVWQLKGAKIISGIKSIGTAIKSLTTGLRTAKTAAEGLQAALGAIGAIATVVSLVVGIFEQFEEEKAQKIAEDFSNAQESLNDLSESLAKIEEQYKGYIDTVKEARSVLDDKTNSTNKLEEAENSLLKLQSDLIRNNKNYQGSLDLVNGSLDEQLKKLKELEEEKVRQEVRDWLDSNSDATYNADQYLKETGLTILFDEKSSAFNQNEALLLQYLKSKGYDAFADIDSNKSFSQQMLDSYAALVGKNTLQTQLTISNFTRGDYIRLFQDLKTDLETSNYTDEERDYLRAKLTDAINFYEKGDYQGYYELINGNQNSSKWIERLSQQQRKQLAEGELSLDKIRKILGLEEEVTPDSDKWTNNIKDVTTRYDKLISSLEKLRDLENENTELEAKKQKLVVLN